MAEISKSAVEPDELYVNIYFFLRHVCLQKVSRLLANL